MAELQQHVAGRISGNKKCPHHCEQVKSEGCVVEHKNLPTFLLPYVHLFLAGHVDYLQREREVAVISCAYWRDFYSER